MAAVRFLPFLSLLITLFLPTLCVSQSDADTLIKFKKSFTQGDLNSWIPGSSPCLKRWVGVMCSGETIIGLHLTGLRLSGQVDVQALLQLRGLRTISLVGNSFTGSIPEFNKLGALRAIYLSRNQFSGEIPNGYFTSMGSLRKVWLNENKFTGNIPESLMQLPHLVELHLEANQFSGTIPELKYPNVLTSLDLSRNNLEGEIPESFSKFNASSFEQNVGLCGKPLGIDCDELHQSGSGISNPSGRNQGSNSKAKVVVAMATLIVILFFVIASIISARRRRDDDFSILSKEPPREEVLQVDVPESTRRKPAESSRRSNSVSKRGSSQQANKTGMANLVMVNDEKGEFGLQDLMKAAAEVLGNGGLGSAYKAVMANGLAVVVKRMREMNRLGKDDFDAEMRRLGQLRHPNILTPLAYHFRREEKLIVSENVPKGSLLYVLHGDRGTIHANLNWPTRLKIIQGIAQGLSFIHTEFATYEIPHGNLKSSNVLLTENYDPLLSDYAFQPLTNASIAAQCFFAYKSPEYLQNQQVSPKSDVYCLGILILEIITGKFPSQYLSNGKGGIDIVQWVQTSISENQVEELIDPEIANDSGSLNQMLQLLQIGAACTESNPDQRLHMKEAISKIQEKAQFELRVVCNIIDMFVCECKRVVFVPFLKILSFDFIFSIFPGGLESDNSLLLAFELLTVEEVVGEKV
ncbi:pollen receptor-like kinase 3 [Durio zibethinus]|uniref:Pollen receptor-like kinase 3 n=1 Tax=Durio zibethinus TaxID=66656 RepID=A0A6P5ZIK2_DURZI|nr:pollen receptor-like kinase 3 [Durio zibethinus]